MNWQLIILSIYLVLPGCLIPIERSSIQLDPPSRPSLAASDLSLRSAAERDVPGHGRRDHPLCAGAARRRQGPGHRQPAGAHRDVGSGQSPLGRRAGGWPGGLGVGERAGRGCEFALTASRSPCVDLSFLSVVCTERLVRRLSSLCGACCFGTALSLLNVADFGVEIPKRFYVPLFFIMVSDL